jgi:VanZ family protein
MPDSVLIKVLSNVVHFVLFFVLAGLLYYAVTETWKSLSYRKVFLLVFIIPAVFGVITEIHQIFVPERYPSIKDIGVNTLGILYFLLLAWWKKKNR